MASENEKVWVETRILQQATLDGAERILELRKQHNEIRALGRVRHGKPATMLGDQIESNFGLYSCTWYPNNSQGANLCLRFHLTDSNGDEKHEGAFFKTQNPVKLGAEVTAIAGAIAGENAKIHVYPVLQNNLIRLYAIPSKDKYLPPVEIIEKAVKIDSLFWNPHVIYLNTTPSKFDQCLRAILKDDGFEASHAYSYTTQSLGLPVAEVQKAGVRFVASFPEGKPVWSIWVHLYADPVHVSGAVFGSQSTAKSTAFRVQVRRWKNKGPKEDAKAMFQQLKDLLVQPFALPAKDGDEGYYLGFWDVINNRLVMNPQEPLLILTGSLTPNQIEKEGLRFIMDRDIEAGYYPANFVKPKPTAEKPPHVDNLTQLLLPGAAPPKPKAKKSKKSGA